MANNFDDSRIIEYWRFENNLTAGKAGNDLTTSGGFYESGSPLEGSYSLNLESGLNNWAYRTDANLSAGFPLKSGDTTKKVSWACRIQPESIAQQMHIIAKYGNGTRSLDLYISNTGTLVLAWGYNNGDSAYSWDIRTGLIAGRIYHIGLAVDGVAKTAMARVWDQTAGTATTYNKTDWAAELHVEDADFVIGNNAFYNTVQDYDGLIDEVVVADDLLSADEFDQIRQGIFVGNIVYNLTHIHTIESPLLTLKDMTVADLEHQQIMDTITMAAIPYQSFIIF